MTDVAMQYSFSRSDHRIEAEDFDPSFHDASIVGSTMGHLTKKMTWILPVMQSMPDWVTIRMNKDMASYVNLQRVNNPLTNLLSPKPSLTYHFSAGHPQADCRDPSTHVQGPQRRLPQHHLPRDPQQQAPH